MEGNLECIIKPSHEPVGCPPLEQHPPLRSCHAPWDMEEQRGRKAGGNSSGVHQGDQEGGPFDGVSRRGGGFRTGIPTRLGILHLTLFCYPKMEWQGVNHSG